MQDGVLSYAKNNEYVPIESQSTTQLLACSERAQAYAHSAARYASGANRVRSISAGVIGSLITGPIERNLWRHAEADSVDALNVHNDDARCAPQRSLLVKLRATP
jgi:hypothetical protein